MIWWIWLLIGFAAGIIFTFVACMIYLIIVDVDKYVEPLKKEYPSKKKYPNAYDSCCKSKRN